MSERLYFDHPGVYVLADYDAYLGGGRALCVVCERPDGAGYAAQLAERLGVPLQHGPAGDEAELPAVAASRRPAPQPPPEPDPPRAGEPVPAAVAEHGLTAQPPGGQH